LPEAARARPLWVPSARPCPLIWGFVWGAVCERTGFNRLQEPEFWAGPTQGTSVRDEASRARLMPGAAQAADNLLDVMENAKQPVARVRASVTILQLV
jgi:hypothetical protein